MIAPRGERAGFRGVQTPPLETTAKPSATWEIVLSPPPLTRFESASELREHWLDAHPDAVVNFDGDIVTPNTTHMIRILARQDGAYLLKIWRRCVKEATTDMNTRRIPHLLTTLTAPAPAAAEVY